MIAESAIHEALTEPRPLLIEAAVAGRQAYAELCGDEVVPWDRADPKKRDEWIAITRAIVQSIIDLTPSPRTFEELTQIRGEADA